MIYIWVVIGILFSLMIKDLHWVTGGVLAGLIYSVFRMQESLQNAHRKIRELQKYVNFTPVKKQKEKPTAAPQKTAITAEETLNKALKINPIHTQEMKVKASPHQPKEQQSEHHNSSFDMLFNFFKGDKGIVRLGAVLLLIGISFLMKTITPLFTLTPAMKCAGIALAGFAFLGLGYWLKGKQKNYALTLTGIGLAILLLNTYSAYFYFELIGYQVAILSTLIVGAFGLHLSLKNDSLPLAVLALGGGFIAPILSGVAVHVSHNLIFAYYLLLNLVILGTAYVKSWRLLNILGFISTFVLWPQWYAPENMTAMQAMLLTFFLIYLAITILYAQKEIKHNDGYVDSIITFALPFAVMGFEYETLKGVEFGYAFATGFIALLYALTALLLKPLQNLKTMKRSVIALSGIFATFTIPLVFDPQETSTLWALEGAVAIWLGLRQNSAFTKYSGFVLQGIAGYMMLGTLFKYTMPFKGEMPLTMAVLNIDFFSLMVLSLAGLFTSYLYREKHVYSFQNLSMATWGFGWLYLSIVREIELYVTPEQLQTNILILTVTLFVAALQWASNRLKWQAGSLPSLLYMPFLAVCGLTVLRMYNIHPMEGFGLISWMSAFGAFLYILKARQGENLNITNTLGFIGFLSLFCFEYALFINHHLGFNFTWMLSLWLLFFGGSLLLVHTKLLGKNWPFTVYQSAYQNYVLPVLSILTFGLVLRTISINGNDMAEFYIPFLNPLEITSILCLFAIYKRIGNPSHILKGYYTTLISLLGALGFIFLNSILARSLHLYVDVPYRWYTLFNHGAFLAGTSILWTVIALTLILCGSRILHRSMWLTGATLIGVVVLKLFFIDMSNVDMLAKTISFMAVGLLLIGVGYFSPIPPAKK
ncbi:MAG: hypothetical protein CMF61_02840 [Magnetococcales bacterium]|nr:hypothetical protein [Magnetococcales bacterium]